MVEGQCFLGKGIEVLVEEIGIIRHVGGRTGGRGFLEARLMSPIRTNARLFIFRGVGITPSSLTVVLAPY
jgi:hypothetical protein